MEVVDEVGGEKLAYSRRAASYAHIEIAGRLTGEFERLVGSAPGSDRIAAVRGAAAELGAVVLLKGPTTVIASPEGEVRLVTSGDRRLATAGTGDVLSGVIGAALARGLEPFTAAGLAAHLHGRAAGRTGRSVIVASDLLPHLAP